MNSIIRGSNGTQATGKIKVGCSCFGLRNAHLKGKKDLISCSTPHRKCMQPTHLVSMSVNKYICPSHLFHLKLVLLILKKEKDERIWNHANDETE